jgi:hypothetical protein
MKRFLLLLACSLLPFGALAQEVMVQFKGTVSRVQGVREGVLAGVQVGDPVEGLVMFEPSVFVVANGDGSTFLRIRAPWTDGLDLMRASLTIGGLRIDTEEYAFRVGNAGLDDDRVIASQPGSLPIDRFFVSDWSSPLDLSDVSVTAASSRILNLTATAPAPSSFVTGPIIDFYHDLNWSAATTLTGSILDGDGIRVNETTWRFDTNNPAADPDRHAMMVSFTIDTMSKLTCQNRVVWVDFGWPWPDHPITCAVSQRTH